MSDLEAAQFLIDAEAFHEALLVHLRILSPLSAQYQSLQKLHMVLLSCIVEVTGDEAPWCRISLGRMPG